MHLRLQDEMASLSRNNNMNPMLCGNQFHLNLTASLLPMKDEYWYQNNTTISIIVQRDWEVIYFDQYQKFAAQSLSRTEICREVAEGKLKEECMTTFRFKINI